MNRNLIWFLASLVLCNGVVASAGAADANTPDANAAGKGKESVRKQEEHLRDPKEVVEEKDRDAADDAFKPDGIALGNFLLLPKVEVEAAFNDNVYARAHDAKADFITSYKPELALRSRTEQNEFNMLGRFERKEYRKYSGDSVNNAFVQGDGRYDLNETDSLNALVSLDSGHEDRGSPDDAGGDTPSPYQYVTGSGGSLVAFGRLKTSLSGTVVQRSFDDVIAATGPVRNHLRDRVEYEEKARVGYEFVPGYSALVEGATNQRVYDSNTDINGFNRDSHGWRLSSGVGVDISQVIRGDILVGYFDQSYDDPRLNNVDGLSVKTMFNWTPSRMTIVVPSLQRSVEETTSTGISALEQTVASLFVRHELRRDIILSGTMSLTSIEYQGSEREDEIYQGMVSGTYLLNKNLYVSGVVDNKRKISSEDASGYNQHKVMLTLGVQY